MNCRAPGANDMELRRADLDDEGIWGEVDLPLGRTLELEDHRPGPGPRSGEGHQRLGGCVQRRESIRHVMPAQISPLDVGDAVAEVERAAELGLALGGRHCPVRTPEGMPDFNRGLLGAALGRDGEVGMVLTDHTGANGEDPVHYHGPGAGTDELPARLLHRHGHGGLHGRFRRSRPAP